MPRPHSSLAIALGAVIATASCTPRPSITSGPTPAATPVASALDPRTPLTSAQRRWVDSTLASLTLRQRVGQMVMIWMLGDYTNTQDSSFAQIVRWIEQDGIGGVSMSLGTPVEVAAK